MPMKVLFLDIDGPLIPLKIHIQKGNIFTYDRHEDGSYVYDPFFIKELNEHCPPQNIKIVFNTAHNDNEGVADVKYCAIKNGLNPSIIHEKYKTKFPSLIDNRVGAIYDWLHENVPKGQSCKWIVVDDFNLPCDIHLENVDLKIGITDRNIINIFSKFMHNDMITFYNEVPYISERQI